MNFTVLFDGCDIAFVLVHNEAGGPQRAAEAVIACFGGGRATLRSAMDDLLANFAKPNSQGPRAYAVVSVRTQSGDSARISYSALKG